MYSARSARTPSKQHVMKLQYFYFNSFLNRKRRSNNIHRIVFPFFSNYLLTKRITKIIKIIWESSKLIAFKWFISAKPSSCFSQSLFFSFTKHICVRFISLKWTSGVCKSKICVRAPALYSRDHSTYNRTYTSLLQHDSNELKPKKI